MRESAGVPEVWQAALSQGLVRHQEGPQRPSPPQHKVCYCSVHLKGKEFPKLVRILRQQAVSRRAEGAVHDATLQE